MAEGYQTIAVETDGPLAVIRLNRPEAMNALNAQMVKELVSALDRAEIDASVRCVVLTGSDRAFCAGADVKEMVNKTSAEMVKSDHLSAAWARVASFPKPVIAAMSGYALGGGLELAMCCDILIASEGAKFGQPEINIGIIPGGGATQRLSRAVGKSKAMEMILTGGMISAEDAKAAGLVTRVVPPGGYLEEAKKLGLEIASKAPLAVRNAKRAVNASQETGLADGLEVEAKLFHELFDTADKKEGMSAFLEKRKPNFTGK